ncbi:nucleoside triphosphate pyrophosphohydrolase family protein [Dongshaea marina]|uniref:nucleoside triphosphate pyrophosphohydrolase family protein n=1 Tax=Dongshaea marina TaxID=2047966 RepID=UPI000D3E5076|nr:nucleoside triphosphate pyrophosphohydrolase family protein [Dongshaea marina]
MDSNHYQALAARTLASESDPDISNQQMMLVWNALGLTGEAGEVADLIKKGVFHQHGVDKEQLKKELGDCLWYISALCSTAGIELAEVMQANIDKLNTRYPQGFTPQDSLRRVDIKAKQEESA